MTAEAAGQPQAPKPRTPFQRLAIVHAVSAASDAMVLVALAGSLFFSLDPSAARVRVALYLGLTMAPFAVVGPFIGPAVDRVRGGHRAMIVLINLTRGLLSFAMIGRLDSLLLFPISFAMLVVQKSYGVAKAAMVPSTVDTHHTLVGQNARLSLISGSAGTLGLGVGLLAQLAGGGGWAVGVAMVGFGVAAFFSFQLPAQTSPPVSRDAPKVSFKALLSREHQGSIAPAARITGTLRAIVGFMFFFCTFTFRGGTDDVDLSGVGRAVGAGVRNALLGDVASEGVANWKLWLVLAALGAGPFLGALLAPRLRARFREERIIVTTMIALLGVSLLAFWASGLQSAVLLALVVGMAASTGKLAFDSIVQRDAQGTNYGRSFAIFETRFQVFWVLGALLPVVIPIPLRAGFLLIAVASGLAVLSFSYGVQRSLDRARDVLARRSGGKVDPGQP